MDVSSRRRRLGTLTRWTRYVGLALSVVLIGCGAGLGRFDEIGFHSTENPYRIRYAKPATRELISQEWRVTNFSYSDGQPHAPLTRDEFVSSLTWTYLDGSTGTVTTQAFDLRISHTTNASIWVRMLPVPRVLSGKQIKFMAENYVNNLSGTAYTYYLGSAVEERRVATQILESESVMFGRYRAHAVTFDVVSLDQLEMNANAPRTRVQMFLVRAPFQKRLEGNQIFKVGALLQFIYSNDAESFDEQLPTFRSLLKRVEFKKPSSL